MSQVPAPGGPLFNVDGGADVAVDNVPDTIAPLDAPSSEAAPVRDGGGRGVADATMVTRSDGATDATSSAHDGRVDAGAPTARSDASDGSESGGDASVCPSGAGTVALLAGTSALALAAIATNGAPWKVTTFDGESVGATPALVSFGGGFLGVFPAAATSHIQSTVSTSAAAGWSVPARVAALAGADAAASEQGSPSLAVLGDDAELVYYGSDSKFYHGVYAGGAWGPASDPVGGATSQDFGPSQPTAATSGSSLFVAFDGQDHGLYVDSWTATGGWAGATGITGAGVGAVPPTILALTGGTSDLMLVYEQQTTGLLYSVAHTAGGGWSTPVAVGAIAFATSEVSLAPLAGGGVVMAYEGASDRLPYSSVYTPGLAIPWTTPVAIDSASLAPASPPTVAAGTCGVDAVAALVEPLGVAVATLRAGVWSPPVLVSALGPVTYAAIATLSP